MRISDWSSDVCSSDLGGAPLAMRVWVDPVKLAARGLTAGDIAAALRANNVQASPGKLKGENTAINITAGTDLRDVDSFRRMVVKTGNRGVVRLGAIATVELGGQNHGAAAQASGRPGVSLPISPTPAGTPMDSVHEEKAPLTELQTEPPPGS